MYDALSFFVKLLEHFIGVLGALYQLPIAALLFASSGAISTLDLAAQYSPAGIYRRRGISSS